MKKSLISTLVIVFSFAVITYALATTCTNVFPTSLNNYVSGNCIPSAWSNALEAKIGINNSADTTSLDYKANRAISSSTGNTLYLQIANNLSDLNSTSSARNNLGYSGTVNNFTYWNPTSGLLSSTSTMSYDPATGNITITATTTVGTLKLSGLSAVPQIYANADPNTGINFPGPDIFQIRTGGFGRLYIDSVGDIVVGSSTTPDDTFAIVSNSTKPIFEAYASTTPYASLFIITNNGNVGVGTTTPAVALSVVGDVTATGTSTAGAFKIPTATKGQLFVADANGVLQPVPPNNATSSVLFLSQTGSSTPTWQSVPTAGSLTYYFENASSTDFPTYRILGVATSTMTSLSFTSIAASTTLGAWLTPTSTPNLTNIPAGLWIIHGDATKSGGTQNLRVYVDVYKFDGVTETYLFTSEQSPLITGTDVNNPQEFDMEEYEPAFTLASTDRLVARFYAVPSGAGSAPSGAIYYQGTTEARVQLPSDTVSTNNFVPYVGATKDVNLGSFGIRAPSSTITNASGTNATYSGSVQITSNNLIDAQGTKYVTSTSAGTLSTSTPWSSSPQGIAYAVSGSQISASSSATILSNGAVSSTQLYSASSTLNGSTTLPALLNALLATNATGQIVATTTSASGNTNQINATSGEAISQADSLFIASSTNVTSTVATNPGQLNNGCWFPVVTRTAKKGLSCATEYKPTSTYTIYEMGFALDQGGSPTGNNYALLMSDNAGQPSNTVLASTTPTIAASTNNNTQHTQLLNTPYKVIAGTVYWVVASSTATPSDANFFAINPQTATCSADQVSFAETSAGVWTSNGAGYCSNFVATGIRVSGYAYRTNAVSSETSNFIGFANAAANSNTTVAINIAGSATGFSGLSPGLQYYLSNTIGGVATSTGSVTRKVGISYSTTGIAITNVW